MLKRISATGLILILSGCTYASYAEAEIACQKWADKGGTFSTKVFKTESMCHDWGFFSPEAYSDGSRTGDLSACRNVETNTSQSSMNTNIRSCNHEDQTRQWLGWQVTDVKPGETFEVKIEDGKGVGNLLRTKAIKARFKY